jgi:nitroimidazol reductase NimA-like FMN-containing flavoprotein (pyridoxamine 5'-phosphate oxidase superfamily)
MVGLLSRDEIENLLQRQRIGRIGCFIDDRPYVVPTNYAYDGEAVYAATGPGRKIDAMRLQPRACFEVDEVDASGTWRSVIADGVFEELTSNRERRSALKRLGLTDENEGGGHEASGGIIVFRINLQEKSGRFGREL